MQTLLKEKVIAIACGLLLAVPAAAAEEEAPLNNAAHLTALVHTTRKGRSWKTGFLLPGKIDKYYYEWVMPNGEVRIKIESHPLTDEGVADRRPLSESHPNLNAAIVAGQTLGAMGGPSLARLW